MARGSAGEYGHPHAHLEVIEDERVQVRRARVRPRVARPAAPRADARTARRAARSAAQIVGEPVVGGELLAAGDLQSLKPPGSDRFLCKVRRGRPGAPGRRPAAERRRAPLG